MRKNNNTAPNSSSGASRILALGVALTIGVWLVILISGKRTEENPTTAKETSTAEREANKEANVIGGSSVAAEFRERHNRALSPEAREDNRRKLWEQNFPYKPTYDPAATVTADMISDDPKSEDLYAVTIHSELENFFKNENRFSPQFEQFYRILEKHGRTANPAAVANAFSNLQDYYRALDHDPEEIVLQSNGKPSMVRVPSKTGGRDTWRPTTWGERRESYRRGVSGAINNPQDWPPQHHEQWTVEYSRSIADELIRDVPNMADIAYAGYFAGSHSERYRKSLKVGDSLMTPYVGYQAAYEEVEAERHRGLNEAWAKQRERKMRPRGIRADGTLVNAAGEPIMASEGSFGGCFMANGQRFDLQEMEDGRIRLSPEAMKALNEQSGNKPPPQRDANSPQISEEEWRLQEAQRMLEESAQQQQ